MRKSKKLRGSSGQALIETALILPLMLMIVLNAVNFAYFFLMALNITSASRSGAIYSVMGGATPAVIPLPNGGPATTTTTVSYLAFQDLTGAVYAPTTNAGVQVCSKSVGILNNGKANMQAACSTYGSIGSFPAADSDPEQNAKKTAPAFVLNRVDVAYQFSPIIPLAPFNIMALATPACSSSGGTVTCTFYRHVEMREMQ